MRDSILALAIVGFLFIIFQETVAGEIYRWVDKNGNVFFSDSPPPFGNFKKQNIEDEIDKVIDQKKEIDKQPNTSKAEKLDEKIRIEMEYEKKATAIKNYQRMREELEGLKEKCQKKLDELKRQWDRNFPRSVGRHDINNEAVKLRRDCEKEARQIRELYGYY